MICSDVKEDLKRSKVKKMKYNLISCGLDPLIAEGLSLIICRELFEVSDILSQNDAMLRMEMNMRELNYKKNSPPIFFMCLCILTSVLCILTLTCYFIKGVL